MGWNHGGTLGNGRRATSGSIDPTTLGSAIDGTAKIAVNFNNDKVQANMTIANHRFEFEGMLNADSLGYTASIRYHDSWR